MKPEQMTFMHKPGGIFDTNHSMTTQSRSISAAIVEHESEMTSNQNIWLGSKQMETLYLRLIIS